MPIGLVKTHQTKIMIILILIVLTLFVYWPLQNFEFVNYDDMTYVVYNYQIQNVLTCRGIIKEFTDTHTGHWHPLTMLSHALDWQLFGEKAGGHHWTNLIIHIFNTILLFLLLNYMTGAIWRSAAVAALFAIHPINVESVAWIAERKNVLSTFFWILTMLFYAWYARQPSWKRYLPVFLCFVLGLMSKPMLVTLPFVLLLMDFWPLKRMAFGDLATDPSNPSGRKEKISFLILEKVPLLFMTCVSMVLTFYAAKSVGTIADFATVPLTQRLYNAVLSYVFYLKKLFWPTDLSLFYPIRGDISIQQALPAALLLIAVTVIVCKYSKRYPYLAVGWFWYLGTLVPVIGIVQVGGQSMADRYAYIPFIGIFIAISWMVKDLILRGASQKIAIVAVTIFLISLFFVTCNQVGYWKNSFSLYERALQVTERNGIAHVGMGNELIKLKRIDEAIAHFHAAININPRDPANYFAFASLGYALSLQNKKAEAIAALKQALTINPNLDGAYLKIGHIYFETGRVDEAILQYKKAIALKNNDPRYHSILGNAYIRKGKTEEAIKEFKEATRIQPTNEWAHNNLGMLFMTQGEIDEATKHFEETIKINPLFANAHYQLSMIMKKKGMKEKALYHYNEVKRINPEFEKMKYE
jgi:tetratricopeptide (TPR) repeat protein